MKRGNFQTGKTMHKPFPAEWKLLPNSTSHTKKGQRENYFKEANYHS
jgi:hypothetical protein